MNFNRPHKEVLANAIKQDEENEHEYVNIRVTNFQKKKPFDLVNAIHILRQFSTEHISKPEDSGLFVGDNMVFSITNNIKHD